MKPVIFVCTITRNSEQVFDRYYSQLRKSVLSLESKYNFIFSLYENDSSDGTVNKIKNADWSFFSECSIINEKCGTSVHTGKDSTRVENLAKARNKCLEVKDFLNKSDWVLFVETDVEYTPEVFERTLLHGNRDVDIFSGIALVTDTRIPYDTWATRTTRESKGFENKPVNFEGGIQEYWATFSCVCLYKSKPFKDGIRFHWINERFGTSDCDTSVICELFRKNGYTKIMVDPTINCYHYLENLVMYAIKPGPKAEALARFIRRACREFDDVVITSNPKHTREYMFILNHDEVPHVMLIKSMDNNILRTKPKNVSINVMNLDLGQETIHNMYENGLQEYPKFETRMYIRNDTKCGEPIQLNAIGALSIWKVANPI
jgi:Cryptococcal mannosyltransferase 1